MPQTDLLVGIMLSACLGALVGLIRQWSDQVASGGQVEYGGVRTYTLWAILGALGAIGEQKFGPSLFLVIISLVGIQQTVAMARSPALTHTGGTTFASVLLTMFTGALVIWEYRQAALLIAATTMVVLGIKQKLHAWTKTFTPEDIRGTMQFVAITGVILPLVPDKNFGPFAAFNPYSTWLMVVFICGLGFAGYIAMRMLGTQAGVTVTGIAGGIASSTATTLAFSRKSKETPDLSTDCVLAVVLACTIMLGRILIVVWVVNRSLAYSIIPAFAFMALPGSLFVGWRWFNRRLESREIATPHLTNPLSLTTAIQFALIYAAIAFLVKAVTELKLQQGMIPLSFISGLTDMDAIALLMANSRNDGSVIANIATQSVIVAAVGNSLMKAGMAMALGSPILRRQIALVLGGTAAAGVASLFIFG